MVMDKKVQLKLSNGLIFVTEVEFHLPACQLMDFPSPYDERRYITMEKREVHHKFAGHICATLMEHRSNCPSYKEVEYYCGVYENLMKIKSFDSIIPLIKMSETELKKGFIYEETI